MKAFQTTYEVVYNGKNITKNILPYVETFSYTDKSQGEADELEIVMENADGLWSNEWYPEKGDTISAKIFDINGTLNCGTFTVDEITGSGSRDGDRVSIKALAAGITNPIRTKVSTAHENKTLSEIANTIAAKHSMVVLGNIDNVRIERVTQYNETDLNFLNRLAKEYGHSFSIRDTQLIFTNIYEIEDSSSSLTIYASETLGWEITDKTNKTYTSSRVMHHSPKKKKLYDFTFDETRPSHNGVKSDTLQLRIRAENKQQAEIKARAALYNANSLQQEGAIQISGNIYCIAGNAIEFAGAGRFSGKYYIHGSNHNVSKDNSYDTSIEIKRVGLVLKSKEKI